MTSRRLLFAFVVGSLLLPFCGGTTKVAVGSGSDGTGGAGGESGGAATGGADPDGGGAIYTGVVVATLVQGDAADTYRAFADFTPGSPIGIGACASAESCCCLSGFALPLEAPGAGTVILASSTGAVTLATLAPLTTGFQGTWDLGVAWATSPGVYPLATSQPWTPGDALHVSAMGGAVPAFSGTLQTGAPLSWVTPAIGGPAAIAVDRTQPFQVSWESEGKSNESVMLMMQQFTADGALTCYCTVPDAASQVIVDPSLLGGFAVEQLSGTVRLERLITATVFSGAAKVDLVGEVEQSGPVTFY